MDPQRDNLKEADGVSAENLQNAAITLEYIAVNPDVQLNAISEENIMEEMLQPSGPIKASLTSKHHYFFASFESLGLTVLSMDS